MRMGKVGGAHQEALLQLWETARREPLRLLADHLGAAALGILCLRHVEGAQPVPFL
eukprot:CAMPEP_0174762858 /NCGR_PEP_ID=MMETSP1094-20130205/109990_1 /TAXON_ID=156173 /ORGANISM="Chrysochromulina brevifilum, Strain UTEX LB 985" /LENGTH=55 /DNA_ID=CAMNT_0015968815 /DNA_START=551 /DNA_END=718 /DNA_ORIENTATION=+